MKVHGSMYQAGMHCSSTQTGKGRREGFVYLVFGGGC